MAEPLAVVPALNTMIPLCSLLVFGASVSRSSLVVKVVSQAVLFTVTTLAWLSQPLSKIQNLITQVWGHDTSPGMPTAMNPPVMAVSALILLANHLKAPIPLISAKTRLLTL